MDFELIKYPIEKDDTIESIAERLNTTVEYLLLIHNTKVEMLDKIDKKKSLPPHLTDIYITRELYDAFREKENKTRPKNNPRLEYKPATEKKVYYVLYRFFQDNEYVDTNFQTSILPIERPSDSKKIEHIVEIDQTTPTLINDKPSQFMMNDIALRAAEVIYPLQIVLNYKGKFIGVHNYDVIVKRWQNVKKELYEHYEGQPTEEYITEIEEALESKQTLFEALKTDAFINVFFAGIYTNYAPNYKINHSFFLYLNSGYEPFEYEGTQQMNEYEDDSNQLTIGVRGKIENNVHPILTDSIPFRGRCKGEYWLNPQDNSIKSIELRYYLKIGERQKNLFIEMMQKRKR